MIQRILVNVNTSPDAGVIRPDRDNSETRLNTFKVFGPKIICRGLAHNCRLTRLLTVSTFCLYSVRSIGDVQPAEDRLSRVVGDGQRLVARAVSARDRRDRIRGTRLAFGWNRRDQ